MPKNETEIVVTEQNVSMKDEILQQIKPFAQDCLRASEPYLVHLAKVWIGRAIRRAIDALG